MRAVVLGATGHIGAHIVRALLAEGHDVRAAYRRDRYLSVLDELAVERVQVNLDTLEGLSGALTGCEWVFHAAGFYPRFGAPREASLEQAVSSTRRVLKALAEAKPQRVVFTSSAATIQRIPGRLASEEDAESWPPASSRPLYAAVKIAMEHEALQACGAGLPVVITNPSLCLGEYDAHPFSGRVMLAYAKYRLPFYLEDGFNAVYTGDVGVGHVRAAARGRIGERYLLSHRNVTLKEFATLVATLAGVPPPRICLPYRVAMTAAVATECAARLVHGEPWLPRDAVRSARMGQALDGSKALRELALPQTPLEEAIQRALVWFRAHGYL